MLELVLDIRLSGRLNYLTKSGTDLGHLLGVGVVHTINGLNLLLIPHSITGNIC